MPSDIACVTCNGKNFEGCPTCNGTGHIEIDCCPRLLLDGGTLAAVKLADLFRKGLPPLAGGTLDQPQEFLDWCDFYFGDMDALRPRLFGE